MPRQPPANTVAQEILLLLRSYPDLQLGDLAEAMGTPTSNNAASGWGEQIRPILDCSLAFGEARNFASKDEAIRILRDELNVSGSFSNLRWNQLPGAAALALLPLGPMAAQDLIHKHQLKVPHRTRRPPRRSKPSNATVEATAGIINAKNT